MTSAMLVTSPEHDVMDLLRVVNEEVLLERRVFLLRWDLFVLREESLSLIVVVVEVEWALEVDFVLCFLPRLLNPNFFTKFLIAFLMVGFFSVSCSLRGRSSDES